jgi:hypothetical protein
MHGASVVGDFSLLTPPSLIFDQVRGLYLAAREGENEDHD